MKRTLYEVLDVEESASEDEIKKAYRKRAKETHPDKNSGKEDSFIEVSKAYAVLADKSKRRRYDETGDTGENSEQNNVMSSVIALIQELLQSLFSQTGEEVIYVDIITEMKHGLIDRRNTLKDRNRAAKKRVLVFQKVLLHLNNRSKEKQILENIINDNIKSIRNSIEQTNRATNIIDKALSLLEDYDFFAEVKRRQAVYFKSRSSATTATMNSVFDI